MGRYNYSRRPTREVRVGTLGIGGDNPVRLQSMTNTVTTDIGGSAAQVKRIADAGGELVRLTTQGVREAEALGPIRIELERLGCRVPISADVHFNPKAAFAAALTADKVRINPGNFVDAARTFRKVEFTDEEYAGEIDRIRHALVSFLDLCRERGVAIRLGVNHGSLSDRIMSRYGDTAPGMVESVMEFLRICREENFNDIIISIKASNTQIMVDTVRLLVATMDKEGMDFPLHLGVTEAGDAEDGRIKSAVGIGALLAEGLGDTIRVSLTEAPEAEIPVAAQLRDYISQREGHRPVKEPTTLLPGNARDYATPIAGLKEKFAALHVDTVVDSCLRLDASMPLLEEGDFDGTIVLTSHNANPSGEIMSWIDRYVSAGGRNPIIASLEYDDRDREALMVKAGADFGAILLSGYTNGIELRDSCLEADELGALELAILQAARLRVSKTEYIACPGCGRTLFDLQNTLKEVKQATSHLKGLKIGVMGCIVNGPGEMADADYGYVGAGPGRVSLYRGKMLIDKNIPAAEALPRLLALIGESESAWE